MALSESLRPQCQAFRRGDAACRYSAARDEYRGFRWRESVSILREFRFDHQHDRERADSGRDHRVRGTDLQN